VARPKSVKVRQHYPNFSFDDQNWLDVTRPDVVSIVETVKKDDGASKTDPIRWGESMKKGMKEWMKTLNPYLADFKKIPSLLGVWQGETRVKDQREQSTTHAKADASYLQEIKREVRDFRQNHERREESSREGTMFRKFKETTERS